MSKVDQLEKALEDAKKIVEKVDSRPRVLNKALAEVDHLSHEVVKELTEALQRERADSINLRRRVDEERQQLADFYKSMVVRELLPAIDNLERALMHIPKDLKNHDYVNGVQTVVKQFEQAFQQLGVERIKTIGEVFDPRYHEAVHMENGSGTVEVVCEELQPGYILGNEVLRHAKVNVRMEKK